ncbi:HlyD family secretion protein, partial [Stenotrophomonas sp. P5_B8]
MNDTLQAPADAPPPNKRKLGIALALVLAIVVVVGLWLAWRSPAEQLQGMADADTVNVAAKITARLAELKVREGDRVKVGQVLFVLDSPEVAAKEEQAQGALEAASAVADKADAGARSEDIRAAQANWKRAEAGATLADATYQRVQNLFNEGVMTRQKRDEALAQARSSRELSNAARAQYDQALAGAREQDKRAAQGQVRQARGAVAEVDAAREEVNGRAPLAGEINKRMADVGELVPAGYPVFTLVDIDRMWVSVNLRESQMRGLK